MTYDIIRSLAAMTGLLIFITLFAGAVLYAFWPGNKARFERARMLPLERDEGELNWSDSNGR